MVNEHVVAELAGGHVHRYAHPIPQVVPSLDLAARFHQDRAPDVDHQVGGLQHGDELNGADHSTAGVAPTQESLDIPGQARLQVHDRLVDDEEFPIGEDIGQVSLQRHLPLDDLVHLLREDHVAVLTHRLGSVHCGVCVS